MKLIINADDFGLSKSITDGIVAGIKGGYITSTSIMMNMPYAEYAIKQAIENGIDCVGLHINLTVGKPLIPNKTLTDDEGVFLYNRKQIENGNLTYEDAYNEIMAQLNLFERCGEGRILIDHLDTHHNLLANEQINKAIIEIAKKKNLPIRSKRKENVKMTDVLESDWTINNVNIDYLKSMLEKYKTQDVVVELVTHSGFIDDYTRTITSYLGREDELNILKTAKQSGLFDDVELINFKGF